MASTASPPLEGKSSRTFTWLCACSNYKTFKDYFTKRYDIRDLSQACPLALLAPAQGISAPSCHLPPDHAARTHEADPLRQHQADAQALQAALYVGNNAGPGDAAMSEGVADADIQRGESLRARWEGGPNDDGMEGGRGDRWRRKQPLMPLQLCRVHVVTCRELRALRVLPALLYRLQVRCRPRSLPCSAHDN